MRVGLLYFLGMLILSGCMGTPTTTYYKLNVEPIAAQPKTSNQVRLMVGPVSVPAKLDRPQLVAQRSLSEVEIFDYHRWAGSLKSDAGRVIAANLARDLDTQNIWNFAQSTQTQFDYQVLIDVQSLEAAPGEQVVLDVFWTIQPSAHILNPASPKQNPTRNASNTPDAKRLTQVMMGRSLVREPVEGTSLRALVAAQSRAFNQVGKDIAKKFSDQK